MKAKRIFYILFIVLISSVSMASMLYAYPHGRIGRSGKQGATCSACHFGTETPELTLNRPTRIFVGQTVDLSFMVDRNSDTETVTTAGFNLAVSDGTLLGKGETPEECRDPSQGPPSHSNKTCITIVDGFTEMSHARPASLVNGQATFDMRYTAPITTGMVTIYGSGVAATAGAGAFSTTIHGTNDTYTIEVLHGVYLPFVGQ